MCDQTEDGQHIFFSNFVTAKCNQLVEGAFGIAHAAFCTACDGRQSGVINGNFFFLGDFLEVLDQQSRRDPP